MPVLLITAALIGVAVLMFFIGLGRAVDTSDDQRLEEYLSDRPTAGSGSMQRRTGGGMASSAGEMAQGVEKVVRSVALGNQLARMLRSADLQMTVVEYLLIWLLSIGALTTLGYFVSHSALPAVLVGFIGAVIPYAVLRQRMSKRLRAFNNQLPGVLMQLSGSMRAGYGLLQALAYVAQETPAPAGREFAIVLRDVKLGRSTMLALDDLLERVESDDLRLVVTAMRIQAETGGNLAEILDTVSETIRERVRIKGELRALTSQQRMAGYVLAALPVTVFFCLMALNPAYESRLFMPGPTLCIPIGAALMMLVGFLILRRVVAIEV
jgi:tight adherence protein B